MAWKITPVKLAEIERRKTPPFYDFIEHSVREGEAYRLGDDGYFIVAPEVSLMPRFVIELALPEKAQIAEYQTLTFDLVERSSGMMWFDSTDFDAYDFAWRMRLQMRAGSPLFAWDHESRTDLPSMPGYRVDLASADDTKEASDLLTSFPQHRGGKSDKSIVDFHFDQKQLYVLRSNSHIAGAAILEDQAGNFASITVIIKPDERNKGLATWFASELGRELWTNGKTLIAGMSSDVPASLHAVLKLKMRLVRQSYTAMIGSI
jgi:hypothetical protein